VFILCFSLDTCAMERGERWRDAVGVRCGEGEGESARFAAGLEADALVTSMTLGLVAGDLADTGCAAFPVVRRRQSVRLWCSFSIDPVLRLSSRVLHAWHMYGDVRWRFLALAMLCGSDLAGERS
jgi:hypothetical protein